MQVKFFRKMGFTGVFLGLLFLLVSQTGLAHSNISGDQWPWDTTVIRYDIDNVSSSYASSFIDAADTWNAKTSDITFSIESWYSNSDNDVYISDLTDYENQVGRNVTAITKTSVTSDNIITEADTFFDSKHTWSTNKSITRDDRPVYDFHSTARHELGHWFKLSHVEDTTHAMNEYYTGYNNVHDDDAAGADFIY